MTNGNDPIQSVAVPGFLYGDGSSEPPYVREGLTKREFFAAMRNEPMFGEDAMSESWAKAIMGTEIPSFKTDPLDNIKWWASAHERFSLIKADALIAELNK